MQSSHSNSSTSTFQEDIGTLGFLGEGLILIAAQQTCSDDDDPAREPSHGPQKIWFNLCHIYCTINIALARVKYSTVRYRRYGAVPYTIQ